MRLEVLGGHTLSRFNREALLAHNLRQGMWVRYDDRIGILTECEPLTAKIMLCREDGTNLLETYVNPWLLRQATIQEIPVPRRPDAETARRLNYH